MSDEVIAEGWTTQGDLVLSISVPDDQQLVARIGAVGLRILITSSEMTIQVPRLVEVPA